MRARRVSNLAIAERLATIVAVFIQHADAGRREEPVVHEVAHADQTRGEGQARARHLSLS